MSLILPTNYIGTFVIEFVVAARFAIAELRRAQIDEH